jgi:hypothetical protein
MNTTSQNNLPSSKYRKLVVAVSIIIPIAVAALFGIKIEDNKLNLILVYFRPKLSTFLSDLKNKFSKMFCIRPKILRIDILSIQLV